MGATETVIVSAFLSPDHSCSIVSLGNAGVNDLALTFMCWDVTGASVDARYPVLVVE